MSRNKKYKPVKEINLSLQGGSSQTKFNDASEEMCIFKMVGACNHMKTTISKVQKMGTPTDKKSSQHTEVYNT